MPVIHRENALGLKFQISNIGSPDAVPTWITLIGQNKVIEVQHSLESINQGFFYWMNGMKVQNAFPFLSSDEREFLMTGITKAEWDRTFSEDVEER